MLLGVKIFLKHTQVIFHLDLSLIKRGNTINFGNILITVGLNARINTSND